MPLLNSKEFRKMPLSKKLPTIYTNTKHWFPWVTLYEDIYQHFFIMTYFFCNYHELVSLWICNYVHKLCRFGCLSTIRTCVSDQLDCLYFVFIEIMFSLQVNKRFSSNLILTPDFYTTIISWWETSQFGLFMSSFSSFVWIFFSLLKFLCSSVTGSLIRMGCKCQSLFCYF